MMKKNLEYYGRPNFPHDWVTQSINLIGEETMVFVEEELTKEDQQKILRDVQCDEKKYALLKKNLEYYTRPNFAHYWVIDHQSGFYLIYVSKNAHYSESDKYFYFYFYNKTYEVLAKRGFIDILYLKDLPEPTILDEFKENLRKAFAVYKNFDEKQYFPDFEIELENKGEC
ncbi:hypothetical protein [Neisseria sp. Ec49-e6-T10]|uniref:hypothetical protein n=1 Tax=Neisseria sp. Ec49-e6-T10 TaxID=3140744 RepID=UPI003EB73F13